MCRQTCLCMNTRSQAGNYSSGGILVAFIVLYDQNRPDPALLGTYCWIHISQVNISSFDFLHDDNILERILKKIEFEEKEGENFEKYLVDTLQKIDSVFFDEILGDNDEDDNEGEEEEDEKDEGKNDGEKNEKEDKNENKNVENQEGKNENKIKKIVFKRKNFDEGKDSISSNLKSSSRFVLKKFS